MVYDSRSVRAKSPYYAWLSPIRGMGGENIFDHRYQNVPALPATGGDPVVGGVPHLGSLCGTEDGRVFQYIQMTGGAAALGTVLEKAADVAVDTVSSGADLLSISIFPGRFQEFQDNDTDTVYLDRVLTTALDVTDCDLTIIRPFRVIAATAAITTLVAGVSIGVLT